MHFIKHGKATQALFVSTGVCVLLTIAPQLYAQPYSLPATAQINLIAHNADDSQVERDFAEAVDNGYVEYVSQIKGFDPHYYGVAQVKRESAEYAAKIEALLKNNPQYRERKVGSLGRDQSVQMTVGELVDKLNHAEQIIRGDKDAAQARNMSVFVQGDVDDWKNRTDRLETKDRFILLAPHEYSLLFNREQGEKQLLAGYSKGNGGQPLPSSTITSLHDQINQLLAKMNVLAPGYSFADAHKAVEPFIVGFLKKQAPSNIAGAQIVKTSWSNTPWLIDKNALGIPVLRRRLGTVLLRVPKQKFLVEQNFYYVEHYAGSGKYQRGADVQLSELRFVKS